MHIYCTHIFYDTLSVHLFTLYCTNFVALSKFLYPYAIFLLCFIDLFILSTTPFVMSYLNIFSMSCSHTCIVFIAFLNSCMLFSFTYSFSSSNFFLYSSILCLLNVSYAFSFAVCIISNCLCFFNNSSNLSFPFSS